MIFDNVGERVAECGKEIALYTPSGAAVLHEISFLPSELTHYLLIICCPLVVMVVKGHRQQRKEARYHAQHCQHPQHSQHYQHVSR